MSVVIFSKKKKKKKLWYLEHISTLMFPLLTRPVERNGRAMGEEQKWKPWNHNLGLLIMSLISHHFSCLHFTFPHQWWSEVLYTKLSLTCSYCLNKLHSIWLFVSFRARISPCHQINFLYTSPECKHLSHSPLDLRHFTHYLVYSKKDRNVFEQIKK